MKRGRTREQLDEDSVAHAPFAARAWEHEAWAFCAPVRHLVAEMLLHGWSNDGEAEACAFLASPGPPVPAATRHAWRRAFGRTRVGTNREAFARIARLRELVAADDRIEVVAPLLVASLDPNAHSSEMRWGFRREKWPRGIACAGQILVACTMVKPEDPASRGAIEALSRLVDLPVAGRAALWIATTRDPTDDGAWQALLRLGEPGAVAVGLADQTVGFSGLPDRPATTKALARIVLREDPWFEPRLGKPLNEWSESVLSERPLTEALLLLPWAARKFGGVEVARDALRRATGADAEGRAVGRALLGDADALPALAQLLEGERVSDRVFEALACLGPLARDVLPRLERFEISAARVARASIMGVADGSFAAVVEAELELARQARANFDEGIVTVDELARTLWCIDVVLRLWRDGGVPSAWARVAMDAAIEHARQQGDLSAYPWTATLASLI